MMHLYEMKERKKLRLRLIALVLTGVLFVVAGFFLSEISKMKNNEETDLLYRSIDKAVVTCYAIEGRYPESLDYLVDHYGVILDSEQYIVDYEIFASNVKPSVHILVKGEQ